MTPGFILEKSDLMSMKPTVITVDLDSDFYGDPLELKLSTITVIVSNRPYLKIELLHSIIHF